jgi:hypothetical protein
MSRKLRRKGEDWLWDRGVWAERSSRGTRSRLHRFRLPAGLVSDSSTRHRALRLPTDRITTPYGFSFAPDGWHPYVATLRAVVETGPTDYRDSILGRFHTRFLPQDLGQALGSGPRMLEPALAAIPHSWPLLRDLWMLDTSRLEELTTAARRAAPTARSPHVGPLTIEDGTDTYQRLLRVHASMKTHGYTPDRFDGSTDTGFDGYQLDGYFLEHDGDFRFVVLHGHHRVGAAACLGIEHLDVVIRRRYIPVVRPDDLPRIAVGTGIPVNALRVAFTQLFEGTGTVKRDAWGLV